MTPERKFVLGVDRLMRVVLFALFVGIVAACLAGPGTSNAPVLHERIGQGTGIGPGFAPMQRGGVGATPEQPSWSSATYALSLDGVDDGYTGSDFGLPAGSAARSILFWIRDDAMTPFGRVVSQGGSNPGGNFCFFFGFPNETSFGIDLFGSYFSAPFTHTGGWRHVAITYPTGQGMGSITVYLDGVEQSGTRTYGGGGSPSLVPDTSTGFLRSGWISSADQPQCSLAELSFWNRALTQPEIAAYMPIRLNGTEPGIVRLYHFDEGVGTTAVDSCGSGVAMTLINGATWTTRL